MARWAVGGMDRMDFTTRGTISFSSLEKGENSYNERFLDSSAYQNFKAA